MKGILLFIITITLFAVSLTAATIDPDNANINYFGRWIHSDPMNPKTTYGNAIHVKFNGTGIGITVSQTSEIYYQYRIDGGAFTVLPLSGSQVYRQLASNLSSGEHTLEFVRRYEASYGITTFHGFTIDGDIVTANPRPPIRIECIGNSITSGFGSEGPHTAQTDNNYEAYGPRLARKIDAEYSLISRSGISVYEHTDGEQRILERYKGQMYTWGNTDGTWDFTTWQPHIVTIMIGTNDYVYGEPTTQQYSDAYRELVEFVRLKNPQAHIYLIGLLAPTNWQGKWEPVNPAIESLANSFNSAGDSRVQYISTGTFENKLLHETNDYSGDMTHPNLAGHEKVAERLFEVIGPVAKQIKADGGYLPPVSSSSAVSSEPSEPEESSVAAATESSNEQSTESSEPEATEDSSEDTDPEETESSDETASLDSSNKESDEENDTSSAHEETVEDAEDETEDETALTLLNTNAPRGIVIPQSVSHITFYTVLGQLIETHDVRRYQGSTYQIPSSTKQMFNNRAIFVQLKE
ncbi:MAG: GDSL-type esterase/lipase family protein [Fibrobacterales bacterium]